MDTSEKDQADQMPEEMMEEMEALIDTGAVQCEEDESTLGQQN